MIIETPPITTRKISQNLELVLFSSVRILVHSGMRMVYPFLAVFGRGLGVSLTTVSLAVTIRNFAAILVPFITSAFDTYGRRLGMLTGLGLFILGSGLVTIWPTFPVFVVALSLTFIGMHVVATSMQAYLADNIPYQVRGRAMVITGSGWALSFVVAVPLLGLLIGRYGWMAPFPVLAGLGILAAIILYKVIPADQLQSISRKVKNQNGIRQVFDSPAAVAALVMTLAFCAGNEVVNLVFGVWMEDTYGLSIQSLGIASSIIGISELICVALLTWLIDKLGKKRTVAIGLMMSGVSALALDWLGKLGIWGAEIGLFFFYLTFQIQFMATTPLVSEVLPSARAALIGASFAAVGVGRMLGALIAPIIFAWGFQYNTLVSAVLFFVALFALSRVNISSSPMETSTSVVA
jgi:predicted MFS family arabinose efflux permease